MKQNKTPRKKDDIIMCRCRRRPWNSPAKRTMKLQVKKERKRKEKKRKEEKDVEEEEKNLRENEGMKGLP